jgi:hypothetical protein
MFMADSRFHKELGKQLSFVENSCIAYDQGRIDEAIRIATSLRILFHDTSRSISLLTHLNAKDIRLLSTCSGEIYPNTTFFDGLSAFFLRRGIAPKLGNVSRPTNMLVKDWWEQVVLVRGPQFHLSRKIIVLTAADKDGGAHVDEKLPDEYMQLVRGVWEKISEGETEFISDHHLLCLRQMGYEVLNSPELTQFAA